MIFLSHSGDDSPAARDFARSLEQAGFESWLDVERLAPGDDWLEAIEAALRQAMIFAVYVGRSGVQRWVDREVKAALMRNAENPLFRIVPVLGEGSQLDALSLFLRQHQALDLRQGSLAPAELKARLVPLLDGPGHTSSALPPELPPFKGLETFQPEDGLLFFGRDREIEELLDRLRQGRFVAVIGDSGSGKSSLVRAGLLPALRHFRPAVQPVGTRWQAAVMRPGNAPFRELANALLELAPAASAEERVRLRNQCADLLAHGVDGLSSCLGALVQPRGQTLIVVDQLEELFTQTQDQATRQRFLDTLFAAMDAEGDRPVAVVVTLRADFYAQVWSHSRLRDLTTRHQFAVSRPQVERLREIIEGPLALTGCRLEPGLAARILQELGDEPGNLPLLEHVLLEFWRRRQGQLLTHAAFEEIGRLQGAINNRAEATFLAMDVTSQQIAQRIFVELTQLAEEPSKDTRRRVPKSYLMGMAAPSLTEQVLDRLAADRLITAGRDQVLGQERVELAHEALIRGWGRLRGWLAGGRADELLRRRIAEVAAEWEPIRDPAILYRGGRLDAVGEWSTRHPGALSGPEESFIAASLAARDAENRRRREQRERSQRMARRVRRLAQILGVTALLAIAAALLAIFELGQARSRWHDAESRALAARSVASQAGDPVRALVLAIAAARDAPTPEAADALRHAVASARVRAELQPVNHILVPEGFSSDGRRAFTMYDAVSVWDTATGRRIALLPDPHAFCASLSPDGRIMATGGSGVRLWDLATGKQTASLAGAGSTTVSVAFSPSGRRVVASTDNGGVVIWNLDGGTRLQFAGPAGLTYAATAVDPTNKTLVTLGANGAPRLWDAGTGRRLDAANDAKAATCPGMPLVAPGPAKEGSAPATVRQRIWTTITRSPDGRWAVTTAASEPGVKLWDVTTGQLHCLATPPDAIMSFAFSPDGTKLLTGGSDDTVRVWDTATGRQTAIVRARSGAIREVFFARAAPVFGALDTGGTVSLWRDGEGKPPLVLHSDADPILEVKLSRDGRQLLTRGFTHAARLWDVASALEPIALQFPTPVWAAFNSDGHKLLVRGHDGTVLLLEVPSWKELAQLKPSAGKLTREPFSPDLATIVTADTKAGVLRLWDLRSAKQTSQVRFPGSRIEDAKLAAGSVLVAIGSAPSGDGTPGEGPAIGLWDRTGAFKALLHRRLKSNLSREGLALTEARDGSVWVTDLRTGRDVRELLSPGTASSRFDRSTISADGGRLVTSGSEPTVWDTRTGAAFKIPQVGDAGQTLAAHLSGDGKHLLLIRLARNGTPSAELWTVGDAAPQSRVAADAMLGFLMGEISPDGRQFITFGELRSTRVTLWDSASGAMLGALAGPEGGELATFSPDGRWILTTGRNSLFVHTVRVGDLLHKAETLVPKSLTPDAFAHLLEPNF
jgi:WD40 repeat protein/energy-coupling factor transporter ATP-binding protein EcfA2